MLLAVNHVSVTIIVPFHTHTSRPRATSAQPSISGVLVCFEGMPPIDCLQHPLPSTDGLNGLLAATTLC